MTSTTGISRRDVMKKGAVAGAIVWSAPILTSSPAFAASGKCSGSKPCVTFYFAKVQGSTCDTQSTSDGGGTGCTNYTAAQLACPGTTPPLMENGCNFVSGSHSAGSGSFTYDPGVVPLIVQVKPGGNCYEFRYDENTNSFVAVAPFAPAACDLQLTVSGTVGTGITVNISYDDGQGCAGISHMNTYFCK